MLKKIVQQNKDCVADTYRADIDLPCPIYNHRLHKNSPIVHGSQDINTGSDEDIDGYSDYHGQRSYNRALQESCRRSKAAATKVYAQQVLCIHSRAYYCCMQMHQRSAQDDYSHAYGLLHHQDSGMPFFSRGISFYSPLRLTMLTLLDIYFNNNA